VRVCLCASAGLVAVAGNCAVVLPWHAFCTGLTGGFFFYGGRLLLWYVWVRAWVHVLGCVCACVRVWVWVCLIGAFFLMAAICSSGVWVGG